MSKRKTSSPRILQRAAACLLVLSVCGAFCHAAEAQEPMHSAGLLVGGRLRPVVRHGPYPFRAHVNHRLDGDHQARLEPEVAAAAEVLAAKVGYLRVFVHPSADAVADEHLHDRKAGVGDIVGHLLRHFAPHRTDAHLLDRQVERALGHV